MSTALDPVGPAPETRSVKFRTLLFGASAAPLFWLGQVVFAYGVTAYVCYPGDHPLILGTSGWLFIALLLFDAVALIACAAAGLVSWRAWLRATRTGTTNRDHLLHTGEGRDRFLSMWGIMSSLWFFCAILFNAIASVTVPPCPG
jgi:hypothetical protein